METLHSLTSALLPTELWRRFGTMRIRKLFPCPPAAGPDDGRPRNPIVRGTLTVLFATAFFINIEGSRLLALEDYPYPGGEYIESAKYFFGLETSWRMYAPGPPDFSGWWVVVGLTADGREIDPITGGAPTLEKPDPTTDHYRSLGGYYWSDFPDEEGETYTTYRRFLLWQDRHRNPRHIDEGGLSFLCVGGRVGVAGYCGPVLGW